MKSFRHFHGINEKRLLSSSSLSFLPSACNNSAHNGRIFIKFYMCIFFENLSRKLKFRYDLEKIAGTLHEDVYSFMIKSRSIILQMRGTSDKMCRENYNMHFIFNNFCCAFYGKMWKIW